MMAPPRPAASAAAIGSLHEAAAALNLKSVTGKEETEPGIGRLRIHVGNLEGR